MTYVVLKRVYIDNWQVSLFEHCMTGTTHAILFIWFM